MPFSDALTELRDELRAIEDLESASAVLEWDQSTYMPDGGATGRARTLSLLAELAHGRLVSARVADLLRDARRFEDRDDLDGALVRRARRKHDRAKRLPSALVRESKQHSAASYVAWTRARPSGDFASMRPYLEKSLELSRRIADCYPEATHVLDPFVDEQDPGMTTESVARLFAELRAALVPLVERITSRPPVDESVLRRAVPAEKQLAFSREIAEALGYVPSRGRIDETHHPFMTRFHAGDVRITTRVREDDPIDCLFSTIHEVGHALYELGIDEELDGSPLGHGASAGIHESQSRLYENFVARSLPFWRHVHPRLQAAFAPAFDDVPLETFQRALRRVERSLIRTEADEVTYNLHVMLRFDLEKALLEGALSVAELPEAWNERMRSDLGVVPTSPREGVLQDVHWYCTTFGGTFQGYTLGNLFAAQCFETARGAIPDLDERLARGDFATLRHWLGEHVHRPGAVYDPAALIERVTGRSLEVGPFLSHLEGEYISV